MNTKRSMITRYWVKFAFKWRRFFSIIKCFSRD